MDNSRYIIITGAGSGIGSALCKQMLTNKQNNVIAISKNALHLDSLRAESQNLPGTLFSITFDLAKGDFKHLQRDISAITPSVDILVNNAGVLVKAPFEDTSIEQWHEVFNVNLFSVVELVKSVLPVMQNHTNTAHIVNISSMGGFQGSSKFRGLSAYSCSKAALTCLSEMMAVEFKGKNIHTNCIALGSVQTEMFNKAFPGIKAGAEKEEIAKAIADFCIHSSSLFNGKVIPMSKNTP